MYRVRLSACRTKTGHLVDWQHCSSVTAGQFKNNSRFLWHFIQQGVQSARIHLICHAIRVMG